MENEKLAEKLYSYDMNSNENEVWIAFCSEVKMNCITMGIGLEFEAIIKNKLLTYMAHSYSRGYQFGLGYYEVDAGDRGDLSIALLTDSKEEAMWEFLVSITREVGQYLEISNRKLNEPMWHYGTQTYDPVLKNWNENQDGWKYDLRYDGRKYWFEYSIRTLSKVFDINSSKMNIYTKKCTDLMNHWFYDQHWGFDKLLMEFLELSNSPEHD